jgi:phosphatidylglycerophosphate synthase
MTGLIICLGLYFASLIFARMILGKGLDMLTMEEKGRFMEITASVRKWSLLFLVVIITLFLLASRYGNFSFTLIFSAYILSLLLFNNGVIVAMIVRKLKAAAMPEFFIKKYIASSIIKITAILLVAACVFYWIKTGKMPI